MKAFSILVPLVSAVYVSAHGILTGFSVNNQNPGRGVIRQVSTQDPNRGAQNPALTCGPNSRAAPNVADANPGDTLRFDWRTASGSPWPHNTGPMITYLADCGDVTCDKFNANNAQWFKIDQVGRKGNGGQWFQQDLMNGGQASAKLPSNLAPGNYLVRHEIIALHLATERGGAEFYPGCAQLRVAGNGNGRPQKNELVTFPGGYSDNDPGIFTPNVFNSGVQYDFPGPNVAAFVNGGGSGPAPPAPAPGGSNNGNGSGSGNNGGTKNGAGGTPTQSSPAPAKTGKSGSCQLKKGKRSPVDADTDESTNEQIIRPRHISRIMRRLAFDVSH